MTATQLPTLRRQDVPTSTQIAVAALVGSGGLASIRRARYEMMPQDRKVRLADRTSESDTARAGIYQAEALWNDLTVARRYRYWRRWSALEPALSGSDPITEWTRDDAQALTALTCLAVEEELAMSALIAKVGRYMIRRMGTQVVSIADLYEAARALAMRPSWRTARNPVPLLRREAARIGYRRISVGNHSGSTLDLASQDEGSPGSRSPRSDLGYDEPGFRVVDAAIDFENALKNWAAAHPNLAEGPLLVRAAVYETEAGWPQRSTDHDSVGKRRLRNLRRFHGHTITAQSA